MTFTNLEEYLKELKKCDNVDELKELHIYDNWPVLLYGNQEKIFKKIDLHFKQSPRFRFSESIVQRKKEVYDFENTFITIGKENREDYSAKEHQVNGLDHCIWIVLHPYNDHRTKAWNFHEMTSNIIDLSEYIIEQNLTARFPKEGLELNYVGRTKS